MTINLDELERLAREATPGPWEVDRNVVTGPLISPWLHSFGCRVDGPVDSDVDIYATAAYIAACSPDVVLGLVERVRRLTRALACECSCMDPDHKCRACSALDEIEEECK